jgi:hypothetical protein
MKQFSRRELTPDNYILFMSYGQTIPMQPMFSIDTEVLSTRDPFGAGYHLIDTNAWACFFINLSVSSSKKSIP